MHSTSSFEGHSIEFKSKFCVEACLDNVTSYLTCLRLGLCPEIEVTENHRGKYRTFDTEQEIGAVSPYPKECTKRGQSNLVNQCLQQLRTSPWISSHCLFKIIRTERRVDCAGTNRQKPPIATTHGASNFKAASCTQGGERHCMLASSFMDKLV